MLAVILALATSCSPGPATPTSAPSVTPRPYPTVAPSPSPIEPAATPRPPTPTPTPFPLVTLRTVEPEGWDQLDPQRTVSPTFYKFFGPVYSGLLRWETGPETDPLVHKVVPDLAEDWVQVDAFTYRFRLREGARWHNLPPLDGRLVNADDVVWSMRRLAKESVHAPLWHALDEVRARDPRTVEITTKVPFAPLPSLLASGYSVVVAPEAVAQSGGDLHNGPVVGTGPFLFSAEESHRERRGLFLRNGAFYEGGKPRVDRLERLIVPDPFVRLALLRSGRVDYAVLGPREAESLREVSDLLVEGQPSHRAWVLMIKHQGPLLDRGTRAALSLALDRRALWEAFSGTGLPLFYGLGMPLPHPAALVEAEMPARDLQEARRLLQMNAEMSRLPLELTVGDFGAGALAAGDLLAQQLREAGLDVRLRVVPANLFVATVQAPPGLFQIAFGPVPDAFEADLWLTTRFHSLGSANSSGIRDPYLDGLIEAQRQEVDIVERARRLFAIQKWLVERAYQPVVFLEPLWTARWPWIGEWSAFLDEPFQRQTRDLSVREAPTEKEERGPGSSSISPLVSML